MQAKKGTEKAGKRIELALVGRKGKEGTDRAKAKAKHCRGGLVERAQEVGLITCHMSHVNVMHKIYARPTRWV